MGDDDVKYDIETSLIHRASGIYQNMQRLNLSLMKSMNSRMSPKPCDRSSGGLKSIRCLVATYIFLTLYSNTT